MAANRKGLILPLLLLAIGTGWLLTTLKVVPQVNWVETLSLIVIGLLAFLISGFDKFSFAFGGVFLATSVISIFRQLGEISSNVAISMVVIVTGLLLLIARHRSIPRPTWYREPPEAEG